MTKMTYPGVVIAATPYTWGVHDAPPNATWTAKLYKSGVFQANYNGVCGPDGDAVETESTLALGDYEFEFTISNGDFFRIPVKSISTWEFPWRPDFSANVSKRPVVSRAQFGDGYTQEMPRGLNNTMAQWELSFNARTEIEAMQIDLFLSTMRGATAFKWKDADGIVRRYTCQDWSRSFDDENKVSVRARFAQTPL